MVDFKKPFNSVEELEQMLDEEFNKSDEKKEDDNKEEVVANDEEVVDDDTSDDNDDKDVTDDNSEDDDEDKQEETKSNELTGDEVFNSNKKEDKKDFAFQELRKNNSQLKQKLSEKEQKIAVWEEIAKNYGYQNAEEMAKVVKERKLEQEAKQKNIDPEVYKRLQEMEERVSRAEKEKQDQQFEFRKREFVGVFDSFIKENSLSENERMKIVTNLENEGWDFNSLIAIKNPKRLLQGYASEIISDRKVQKNLEEEKINKLSENKFKNPSKVDKSVDDIVRADLAKYARERGIKI